MDHFKSQFRNLRARSCFFFCLLICFFICGWPILPHAWGAAKSDEAPPSQLTVKKDTLDSQRPFWRRKPALMERIREERAIIVAVRREDTANDQVRFTMAGAGWVAKPKDFCFQISQQYPRLKEISEHFRTVDFDSQQRQLFLVTEALGYQARMILHILPVNEDWRSELQWQVVWGHFKGMTGQIGFEQVDGGRTEMSINAHYEAAELPLPRVLMGFALEVITQKVAEKMRAFIEAQPASALEWKPAAVALPAAAAQPNLPPRDLAQLPPSSLDRIKLPPGFSISVFARDVPSARQMTLSPAGTLYVGSRESGGRVYAIAGAAKSAERNEPAAPAQVIAKGLNNPNGVAFKDGSLFVAEIARILRYDEIESRLGNPPAPKVVRSDYPNRDWHGWKYIAIGPDGWLYVPVGAPCNVCLPPEPIFASITRMSLDGKKREIFATGIRNTVGFDWDPRSKQLWFTDNGRDMLGDDIPADELNHAPRAGLTFGFPFCHQGDLKDLEFGQGANCSPAGPHQQPKQKLGPHVAALGMKFYRGSLFPKAYNDRVFIAEHGSWNRSKRIGYRVTTVRIGADGKASGYEPFAEGWLEGEKPWGRPVDILNMPDGSLLVSDDLGGVIFRITYKKNLGE